MKKREPLISVILPVLNGIGSIESAITSVIEQRYENVELIVLDGGSDDGTVDCLRRMEKMGFKWYSESDCGIYDAMNKGVALASGDWLYFLGSDDILVNCLHRICRRFRGTKTVYYGNVYLPYKNRVYAGAFDVKKLKRQNICHQAIFYPKSVFESYAYLNKYPRYADWHLNIVLFGDRKFRYCYINELVAIHEDRKTITGMEDPNFFEDQEQIFDTHLRNMVFSKFRRRKKENT